MSCLSTLVPSGTPRSFTGYLSRLRKSIKFAWSAIDTKEANGPLTGYNFQCNYTSETDSGTEVRNFTNNTFQFELDDVVGSANYECVIAASTRAGKGPNTAAVIFTTPGNIEGTHITGNNNSVCTVFSILRQTQCFNNILYTCRSQHTQASIQCGICNCKSIGF